jgi:hypothetical protein
MHQCQRFTVFYMLTLVVGGLLSVVLPSITLALILAPLLVAVVVSPMIHVVMGWIVQYRDYRERKRNFPAARVRRH